LSPLGKSKEAFALRRPSRELGFRNGKAIPHPHSRISRPNRRLTWSSSRHSRLCRDRFCTHVQAIGILQVSYHSLFQVITVPIYFSSSTNFVRWRTKIFAISQALQNLLADFCLDQFCNRFEHLLEYIVITKLVDHFQ
jgi:hypothetical protein